jgi:glutamate-1-semialdehyde 2,1-aminomutase
LPPPALRVRSAGNQFPITVAEGQGARFRDVDGLEYVDFCLGDTGAMAGHAPAATVQARGGAASRRWLTQLAA